MLRGVLEAQAPPKQNATDTINTLSDRLNNATLLEDRRTAILGLRSFAKEFPASVASGSLRGLITSLTRDTADVDTGKVILETLLNLFNPLETSPEASDDIALWLADEFTQNQDNITALLDLLEEQDFYARLYSLQLLAAISSARPDRTQECILSAPLGTSRMVAVLQDPRDPVRAAALLLLIEVTQTSAELQKLVAFEGAFQHAFDLIQADGSLSYGSVVVQDCLSLLANLVNLNPPNQSLFRESGFVGRLLKVLQQDQDSEDEDDLDPSPNRDKNLYGFIALIRMFLVQGNTGTLENQTIFVRQGLLHAILDLGFDSAVATPIRAEALRTCGDMIRGNSSIQESFGATQVNIKEPPANGEPKANGTPPTMQVYVIDALLDMALTAHPNSLFDVRYAAAECVQSYFYNHQTIRLHFIDRAIYGFTSEEDGTSNILTILMGGPTAYQSPDPYRIWFSALLAFQLLFEEPAVKEKLRAVTEGDEEKGEEVVSCVQSITGSLVASLQAGEDGRVVVGYLMLLCGWLFEDVDAVNDLLSEGSTVQSLISAISKKDTSHEVEHGLVAFLLGICYEFSTKDSPIPRKKLQPLLMNGLGRERYSHRLAALRQSYLVREFEVTPQNLSSAPEFGMLPEVFFDHGFMEFFKDNYSRILRCVDKDPGLESIRPMDGIDRDLVDKLQAQIDGGQSALKQAEKQVGELSASLEQQRNEVRRLESQYNAQQHSAKSVSDKLQNSHSAELNQLRMSHNTELEKAKASHAKAARDVSNNHQKELNQLKDSQKREMTSLENRLRREMEEIRGRGEREIKDLQRSSKEAATFKANAERDIKAARSEADQAKQQVGQLKPELDAARQDAERAFAEADEARQDVERYKQGLEKAIKVAEKARQETKDAKAEADSARAEADKLKAEMEQAKQESGSSTVELERAKTAVEAELATSKSTLDKAQKELESVKVNLKKSEKELESAKTDAVKAKQSAEAASKDAAKLKAELEQAKKQADQARQDADKASKAASSSSDSQKSELDKLQKRVKELEGSSKKAEETVTQLRKVNATTLSSIKDKDTEISSLKKKGDALEKQAKEHEAKAKSLDKQIKEAGQSKKGGGASAEAEKKLREELKEKEEARTAAQAELDDLLIVLGDLEEKRARDKKTIKDLGGEISDDDDDDDEDDDNSDDVD